MSDIAIATEITSGIFLLIFLYSVVFEDKRKDLKKYIFSIMLICWIISVVIDSIGWKIVNRPNMGVVSLLFAMASFFMAGIQATAGAYYILAHINMNKELSYWYAHFVAIFNAFAIIVMIVLTIGGKTYSIENEEYIFTPMYIYLGFVITFSLLYMIGLIIRNRKALGTHDTIAFVIYLTIPLIATVIQCIWNDLGFSYVASSISVAILFVMLQSGEINEARMREEILNKVSNRDPLTGLNNRRAYDTFLLELTENEHIGVVFCDLNGLKITNDQLGHAEGDKLICKFAKLIKMHFKKESIFRISGDEFVVIMVAVTEKVFDEKINEFRETITSHDSIAAMGSVYGESGCALDLVSKAEENMYSDKNYYYYSSGKERRKR